ncbi:MAG: winged helix-turn-helix domain-containing protein [Blastocatellia bacterium]
MSQEERELYEFGPFRLDVREHTFTRIDGIRNGSLPEKSFQTLCVLVRNSGRLLTKQELLDHVWPDSFVEENNLDKCIHAVRQALGERPGEQKYIETVRKHGYRFVAVVKKVETPNEAVANFLDRESTTDQKAKAVVQPTISTLTTTSGAFVLSAKWSPEENEKVVSDHGNGHQTGSEPRPARIPKRTSRTVKRSIFTAVLFLAASSATIYFLAGSTTKREGTNNEEARRLYLMAMNLSEERGVQNVLKSLEYLNRAVEIDPKYAIAWAAKAHTHRDIVGHTDSGQHEHYQLSMKAISKALAIDPNLSEAYSALCFNKNRYEYNAAGAETACKRALELNPDSPVAHKTYANFLYSRGRFDEAIVEIKAAMDFQPVSYKNQQLYALTLYYARRYGEAEEQFKRLIELNPNHSFIHGRLVRVLEDQGKESEAFDYLIEMLTIQKTDGEVLERYKTAYRTEGWRGVVAEQIRTAEAEADPRNFQLACLHAKIGNKEKAFEYLEKAYQERSFMIAVLRVEPQLASLHDDPRFSDLVRRVEGN